MSDLLRMDYINSLPQPFLASLLAGDDWPVLDICVQTGLVTIDVCGMFQVTHIGDISRFIDDSGAEHDAETFYSDFEPEGAEAAEKGGDNEPA